MSAHHVDLPEQVVTPAEELWVKIIDLDLERRRISLSIKQAAEGGVVAAEYQQHFGEQNYDSEGNYTGEKLDLGSTSEGQEAWAEFYSEQGLDAQGNPLTEAEAEAIIEEIIEEAIVEEIIEEMIEEAILEEIAEEIVEEMIEEAILEEIVEEIAETEATEG